MNQKSFKSNDTLVTIIGLCYNHEKFLSKSIISILNQSYSNIELILVDDFSSDHSLNILGQFNDDRITVIKHDFNKGINRGIEEAAHIAKGDYILLFATDDLLTDTCVEDSLNEIGDRDILFQNFKYINFEGLPVTSRIFGKKQETDKYKALKTMFYTENCFYSPGMLIKRESFLTILPLDNSISLFQDYKINIQLLINNEFKVSESKNVIYRVPSQKSGLSFCNDNTIISACLQQNSLMNAFLSIPDIKMMKMIFGDCVDYYKDLPNKAIPYILGMLALKSDNLYKKLWGYNIISNFINNYENYEMLNRKIGFSYKDFLQLSSFFSKDEINGYLTNAVYSKKIRKYKKITKALSVFLLLLVIVCITFFLYIF